MTKVGVVAVSIALMCAPSLALASISANLQFGSTGAQVIQLQNFLISGNFMSGPATGNFFSKTLNAVKAYQKSAGLPATGFVGPLTRTAIAASASSSSAQASAGSVQGVAQQVQSLLQQISELQNGTPVATSSIPQTFATSSLATTYDPSWTNAIVNLFCTARYGDGVSDYSSGSGVIIDPRGVILTNAHVAYMFLFANWPQPSLEDCYVRTGSPAENTYRAQLLYIPEAWVENEISSTFSYASTTPPIGQKDYALLLITGSANGSNALPVTFPYLSVYQGSALPVQTSTYLMGYAAENLGTESILRDLYLLTTPATVAAQRPIGTSTSADVIAFSGALASQHGVSGGAVVSPSGQVAGLLSFLDDGYGDVTSDRVLNAITTDYIQRDFAADNGQTLQAFISARDLGWLASEFDADQATTYRNEYVKDVEAKGYAIPGVN